MFFPANPLCFARDRQGSMLEAALTREPTAEESRQTAIDQLAAGIIGVVAVTGRPRPALATTSRGKIRAVMRDPVQSAPAA
jgi:hypothetical protein